MENILREKLYKPGGKYLFRRFLRVITMLNAERIHDVNFFHDFSVEVNRNHPIFRQNPVVEGKKSSVSGRAKHGLSSYRFISFSKFFAKIDFFEGEGP